MLPDHIAAAIEMADPDDHDLAQPAVEVDLPAHRVDQVEPDFGDRWRMQQELVDVDHGAAPSAADLGDDRLKLGVLVGFDQGDAGHAGGYSFVAVVRDHRMLLGVVPAKAGTHTPCLAKWL